MRAVELASAWAIPVLLAFIPLYGYLRGVRVYDAFIEGAREGLEVAVRILPYMVSIFVALAVFRASGALELLARLVAPLTSWLGVPPEVLPLMLIRPLSGGAALAVTAELLQRYGPDSYIGRLASTMHGSTDTTFYVLTLYFGSVGVKNPRYAVVSGVAADLAGFVAAVLAVRWWFGH